LLILLDFSGPLSANFSLKGMQAPICAKILDSGPEKTQYILGTLRNPEISREIFFCLSLHENRRTNGLIQDLHAGSGGKRAP